MIRILEAVKLISTVRIIRDELRCNLKEAKRLIDQRPKCDIKPKDQAAFTRELDAIGTTYEILVPRNVVFTVKIPEGENPEDIIEVIKDFILTYEVTYEIR